MHDRSKHPMRVAIRVDASALMGTGHLRRCMALAEALRDEGAQTRLVCRAHDSLSELAIEAGAVAWLPAPDKNAPDLPPSPSPSPPYAAWAGVGWDQDATQTVAALRDFAPEWVIVDHYALDARWHRQVARGLGTRLAVIDDLADRPLDADLLVDHNLHPDHRAKYAGCMAASVRILGGPRFALLAKRYAAVPRYRFREPVQSIGIFMGGADPEDFTSLALEAIRTVADFKGRVELISSSRSPHHRARVALAARWPATEVLVDLPDLCSFFSRHDLQIGAGGGAAWERCCIGAPTVAVPIAANQNVVLPQLAALGALHTFDLGGNAAGALGGAIAQLLTDPFRRERMTQLARSLVDGLGSARVAAVLSVAGTRKLSLRPAGVGESELLLQWANNPDVRRNAFNTAPISLDEHVAWFHRCLADPQNCFLLIAYSPGGMPLGQVRFDLSDGFWDVDYSLDPAFRGWGLARTLLQGAIAALRQHVQGQGAARAFVKPDNMASIRAFRSMKFSESQVQHRGMICHLFLLNLTGGLP